VIIVFRNLADMSSRNVHDFSYKQKVGGGDFPLFWVKKEEMTEGRKAGRAS